MATKSAAVEHVRRWHTEEDAARFRAHAVRPPYGVTSVTTLIAASYSINGGSRRFELIWWDSASEAASGDAEGQADAPGPDATPDSGSTAGQDAGERGDRQRADTAGQDLGDPRAFS